MSKRYKITALKDIAVTAYIIFLGSIKLPPNPQGESLGRMSKLQNRRETIELHKGAYRDDIALIEGVIEGFKVPTPCDVGHPEIGMQTRYKDLLLIERLE